MFGTKFRYNKLQYLCEKVNNSIRRSQPVRHPDKNIDHANR